MLKALSRKDYRGMWAFAEMVASLMYDILYTKAGVIHTWPGYISRLMSSLAIIPSSFLLFHFSGKAGHSKTDVAVTYTLLAGAFLLEMASLLGALVSTWAYAFLSTTRWSWLRYATLCTGRWDQLRGPIVKGGVGGDVSDRRWSGRMGQYNMLHFSSRRKTAYTPMLGRVVSIFGFEEFWNRKHFGTTVDISDDLKQQLFEYIQRTTKAGLKTQHAVTRKSCWGQEALEEEDRDLYERIKENKILGVEFQDGIIIWHIGTDIFLAKRKSYSRDVADLVKSIRMLSNYMMFLVVEHPNMLPGLAQTTVYHQTCENLSDRCRTLVHPSTSVSSALREIFSVRDDPDFGEQRQTDELANIVYKERPQYSPDVPRLSLANGVAEELVNRQKHKGSNSVLKLLLNVWMDFLVYAANRCSRESHAKKLGRGGELTTVV
jgi:hypothetical protein